MPAWTGHLWTFTLFGEDSTQTPLPLEAGWLRLGTSPRLWGLIPRLPTQAAQQNPGGALKIQVWAPRLEVLIS